MSSRYEAELKKLFSPERYKAGTTAVLSDEEEITLAESINCAAGRGFAINVNDQRQAITKIASDGRKIRRNGTPGSTVFRPYRARHQVLLDLRRNE